MTGGMVGTVYGFFPSTSFACAPAGPVPCPPYRSEGLARSGCASIDYNSSYDKLLSTTP